MKKPLQPSAFSPWPNRVAKLLAVIVFPLIWVGGLVTTSDAGMAVPDWPNTYNYNMFAYPIRDWFFGPWDLFVEHGHRLLGSLAGIIAIGLCLVTFAFDRRKSVRWWSVLILGLVTGQGILGGQRVTQDARLLALIHGCLGPAFFATVVAMIVFTSWWWVRRIGSVVNGKLFSADLERGAAAMLLILSYVQLIFGASLRHIAETADPSVYILLLIAHLTTALAVWILALVVWYAVRADNWKSGGVRATGRLLMLLVFGQIGLGVGTYAVKFGWPSWLGNYWFAANYVIHEKTFWQVNLITSHVAVGSLILATATYHLARVCRAIRIARKSTVELASADRVT